MTLPSAAFPRHEPSLWLFIHPKGTGRVGATPRAEHQQTATSDFIQTVKRSYSPAPFCPGEASTPVALIATFVTTTPTETMFEMRYTHHLSPGQHGSVPKTAQAHCGKTLSLLAFPVLTGGSILHTPALNRKPSPHLPVPPAPRPVSRLVNPSAPPGPLAQWLAVAAPKTDSEPKSPLGQWLSN